MRLSIHTVAEGHALDLPKATGPEPSVDRNVVNQPERAEIPKLTLARHSDPPYSGAHIIRNPLFTTGGLRSQMRLWEGQTSEVATDERTTDDNGT